MSLRKRRTQLSKNKLAAQLRNVKHGDQNPSEMSKGNSKMSLKMKKIKSHEELSKVFTLLPFIYYM